MGVKCYLQKEYITQHTPETFVNASAHANTWASHTHKERHYGR